MEKILIVDDSKVQLLAISMMIKKEGYDVHKANDPKTAQGMLLETKFDLLLCDLKMPEIDGIQMLRFVKSHDSYLPVIIMTAFGDRDSAIEALSLGAEDYIFKTTGKKEDEEFIIRIKRALEKSKMQKRLLDYKNELEKMVEKRTDELRQTQDQLIQSEKLRSLGVITSGVAHDFNNILGVILGRTQLLLRDVTDESVIEDLESIEKSALKGAATIKRMQDYTRIRKDEAFVPVRIQEIMEEVVEMTRTRWKDAAEQKGISVRVNLDLQDVPDVEGNASELKDVFINIIFNAIDAMPEGGDLTIKTYLETILSEKWVTVEIRDTGVGIDSESKMKIFDPFFTTKMEQGSGLGMSVAYGIIERHKGHIKFSSTVGMGTVFHTRLPMALYVYEEPGLEKPEGKKQKEHRPCNILVVDDDDAIRLTLTEMLEIENHKVVSASSGQEALVFLANQNFDIVFTDLGMPGMSGWEVSKEVKRLYPSTKVVMITGWGGQLDSIRAKESGIEKIIPKPVSYEEILNTVKEYV